MAVRVDPPAGCFLKASHRPYRNLRSKNSLEPNERGEEREKERREGLGQECVDMDITLRSTKKLLGTLLAWLAPFLPPHLRRWSDSRPAPGSLSRSCHKRRLKGGIFILLRSSACRTKERSLPAYAVKEEVEEKKFSRPWCRKRAIPAKSWGIIFTASGG